MFLLDLAQLAVIGLGGRGSGCGLPSNHVTVVSSRGGGYNLIRFGTPELKLVLGGRKFSCYVSVVYLIPSLG